MRHPHSFRHNIPVPPAQAPAPLLTMAEPQPIRVVRKNQKEVEGDFPGKFKAAIQTLIARGNYSRMVDIHADMDHRMHSMNGPVGTRRFLSWHRIYLIKFEAELRIVEPSLYIPYWDWTIDQDVPEWLKDFLPQGTTDLNGNPIKLTRFPGTDPTAPNLPSPEQLGQTSDLPQYLPFTTSLEGLHNTVHTWVGGLDPQDNNQTGTMDDIMYSPADPVFWLHHAFIDRTWAGWEVSHPGQVPPLEGIDRILDPWAETMDDAIDIAKLGYSYDV